MTRIPLEPAMLPVRVVATLEREGPTYERFAWAGADGLMGGALLRLDHGVRAFVDLCPHWNVPLTQLAEDVWRGDRLRCSIHGAEFDTDGACINGPCEGAELTELATRVDGAQIEVLAPCAGAGGVGGALR